MSYNNNLPQVFQRLGTSTQLPINGNNNRRQYQQCKQDQRSIKKTVHLNNGQTNNNSNYYASFPDYSAITSMNEDLIHHTPNNIQQQQQSLNGYPIRKSFNFVKNEPTIIPSPAPSPQEVRRPFTFLKTPIITTDVSGNYNYYSQINQQLQQQQQQQQQQQHRHHIDNSNTLVTRDVNTIDNQPQKWNNHQRNNSNTSNNNNATMIDEDNEYNTRHRYHDPSTRNDIAKKIQIVTCLQKDKSYDSDSSTNSNEKETVIAKRKITVTSQKRNRSSSRDRSPSVKKSKRSSVSPSRRKRSRSTSSDDHKTSRNARLCRRPRRRSTHNHDDSDEGLAPFLRGEYDHYSPKYELDDEPTKNDTGNDNLNTRLSKKSKDSTSSTASILKSRSAPNISTTTAAASNLNVSTRDIKSNASSPTTESHNKVWVNPVEKYLDKGSVTSILLSCPLPPSKKFTPLVKPQVAVPMTKSPTTTTTIPLSHKIITASKTIVPPKTNVNNNVKPPLLNKTAPSKKTNENLVSKNNSTLNNASSTQVNSKTTVPITDKNGILHKNSNAKKVNHSLSPDNATLAVDVDMKNSPITQEKKQEALNVNNSSDQVLKEREARENEAKKILRSLDIDEREDIVMDVVPVTSNNGQKSNKVVVKNKHHPENFVEVPLKLEFNTDVMDSLHAVTEKSLEQAIQKVLQSVSQLTNQLNPNEQAMTSPTTTTSKTNINPNTATADSNHIDSINTIDNIDNMSDTTLDTATVDTPIISKAESPSPADVKDLLIDETPNIIDTQDNSNFNHSPLVQDKLPVINEHQENTISTKKKNSRLTRPWKVEMTESGDIFYKNPKTGEIRTTRPVA